MNYTSVKIPKKLAEDINNSKDELGFRSVSDFVLFATRQRLREITKGE